MRKWPLFTAVPGVALAVFALLASVCATEASASTRASGTDAVYLNYEQAVALPSQNGQSALVVLTASLVNDGAHTVAARFGVPAGFHDAALTSGAKNGWRVQDGALVDLHLPVGSSTLTVQGLVPLAQQAADLTFIQPYVVQSFYAVIPEGALVVSAQGGFAPSSQTFAIRGVHFRRFTRPGLAAGEPLTLAYTLLPTANVPQASPLPSLPVLNSDSAQSADWEAIGNLLVAVAIVGVGLWSIRRAADRQQVVDGDTGGGLSDDPLGQWAQLELLYRKGGVARDVYEQQRAEYRKRAVDQALTQHVK